MSGVWTVIKICTSLRNAPLPRTKKGGGGGTELLRPETRWKCKTNHRHRGQRTQRRETFVKRNSKKVHFNRIAEKNDSNKCFFRFSSVSEKNYEKMAACEEQLRRLWTRSKHNRPKMQKYPEQNRCKSKQSHRYCAPALFHPCNFFVQKFVQEDSCCSRRMGISLTGTKT